VLTPLRADGRRGGHRDGVLSFVIVFCVRSPPAAAQPTSRDVKSKRNGPPWFRNEEKKNTQVAEIRRGASGDEETWATAVLLHTRGPATDEGAVARLGLFHRAGRQGAGLIKRRLKAPCLDDGEGSDPLPGVALTGSELNRKLQRGVVEWCCIQTVRALCRRPDAT
jgi:hypothetical protein